jgi:hypothetical protein
MPVARLVAPRAIRLRPWVIPVRNVFECAAPAPGYSEEGASGPITSSPTVRRAGRFLLGAKYTDAMKVSDIARDLGRRGGRARARRLPGAERTRIASLGGRARAQSLEAARRIVETLRYAAAADELRGWPVTVRRLRTCAGPLPGIYPNRS